ncbi:MAG TPA: hypothetical protein VK667_03705 [Ktedonobacteraceae bacterium]|nr:hypothetical protein [Ktedonobacteraceae bacterium]
MEPITLAVVVAVIAAVGVMGYKLAASPSQPVAPSNVNTTSPSDFSVATPAPQWFTPPGNTQTSFKLPSSTPSSSQTVVSSLMGSTGAGISAGLTSGAAAGAITAGAAAVIGIAAGLMAAHAQRKQQATDENSAMNNGVQQYDIDVKTINTAYQNGQITKPQVIQLVQQATANYWALVSPKIQPQRNGCNSGNNCPQCRPSTYCSGSIGAACCTGCVVINPSSAEIINIMNGVYTKISCDPESVCPCDGGTFWRSIVRKVFASKYGGMTREPFTLDWKK